MSKKEILIIEDEDSLLKLQSLLLTARGHKVHGLADGKLAFDYVLNKKPDLVLLDIMLPDIDGFEVCRQIKNEESTKSIPVIIVTSKKSRDDMRMAEQVGADWYITKPFKSSMLVETVQRFLLDGSEPGK